MPDEQIPRRGRAANGDSSIVQSGGRWHGFVTVGTKSDGSLDRRHVSGKDEPTVRKAVEKLMKARDLQRVARPGRPPTVGEWVETYLTTIAPRTASRETIESSYRPKLAHWVLPVIGKVRIDKLRPEQLDEVYVLAAEAGCSQKTVLMIHGLIRQFLKAAWKREVVGRNVALMVDAPTAKAAVITPPDEELLVAFCRAALKRRNGLRWVVACVSAQRQAETLGMRWSMLDLDKGRMQVWQLKWEQYVHGCPDPVACAKPHHREPCPQGCTRHAKRHNTPCAPGCTQHARMCPDRQGGRWVFRRPKGGEVDTIPLPPELPPLLREHRKHQLEERLAAGSLWEDWDLVFCRWDGKPINPSDDWEECHAIGAEVGAPDFRPHWTRHGAATLLSDLGVELPVIQELLRHRSANTTKLYAKVTARRTRPAVDMVGKRLLGGGAKTNDADQTG